MTDLAELIASLPDPKKDKLPPRVMANKSDQIKAEADRRLMRSLLNPKNDTERTVKYILEGPLFGGKFRKDGDWKTLPGGREVFQKKVSDLVGGVPVGDRPNAHTYVEVKAVSPGQSFAFSRLDKRTNKRQPSQQEKLTAQWAQGNLVWLAIGWWDRVPGAKAVPIQKKSRELTKWKKCDVDLTVTLLRWKDWLEIYESHKFRSIRQKDRHLLDAYRIVKVGGIWRLDNNHWWRKSDAGRHD